VAALLLLLSSALPGTHAFRTPVDRRAHARGRSSDITSTAMRTRTWIGGVGKLPGVTSPGSHANGDTGLRASGRGDGEYPGDDTPLGSSLRGLNLRDTVEVGDRVVCKRSVPGQGIYENASYEVTSIYVQSFDDETQTVSRVKYGSLDEGVAAASSPSSSGGGGQLYMTLYSPRYHEGAGGAVVTPEEAGLATVRSELTEAAWLALPGFVWIVVASTFYGVYHERTGGSLADAFLGR